MSLEKYLKMSSDQDSMSESTSPGSYMESPHSSPSQQVPQLANCFTELSCAEINAYNRTAPFLRIVEQPQNHFRFRYKSEMVGTHGCILGKTSSSNKTKTHPMVELVNYDKSALIRCRLAQHLKPDEHPHQLLEDEQEDRDVSALVPEHGSYRVGFAGMGIIHTAKKDVPSLLYKKYKERLKLKDSKELLANCEAEAKGINLNIVRLRFSAHDINTDQEICDPVFSEPIHNMKSAATNDLKICRISRLYGHPKGGDDVYILVEKVNKKNIDIRFVERNEMGEECWSAKAHFLQTDVHHQYAIVFRTPAYKDQKITSDVKVQVELFRPSDQRTSDPKEFTYRADPLAQQAKKRKANSPYSSYSSLGSGSIKSLTDLPAPIVMLQKNEPMAVENEMAVDGIVMPHAIPDMSHAPIGYELGDALLTEACEQSQNPLQIHYTVQSNPIMPQTELTPITLDSTEFTKLLDIPLEQRDMYTDYVQKYISSSDFFQTSLEADSGRGKGNAQGSKVVTPQSYSSRPTQTNKPQSKNIENSNDVDISSEYTAVYTPEHGSEVKKLVKEICDLLRTKTGVKKQVVKEKLERLFAMRLSNEDTFLHMTLYNNRASFEYIVKLVHTMKMPHLLNLTNEHGQTILHTAIMNDIPQLVSFLVSKGCDPSVGDREGNNAVHYAVTWQACMEPLLNAIKNNGVQCDLNGTNKEKQTPLHLAAVPGSDPATMASSEHCITLLLKHGASYNARDLEGRTPLHIAALDDCLPVVRALLDFIPSSDIDAVDGRGNTAMQIVCGGSDVRPNSVAILKLLIGKKADPMKHEPCTVPAYRLVKDKPELRPLLEGLVSMDTEIKSEPEDEYESADEGDDACLSDLPLYLHDVSHILDSTGGWRALAGRLQHTALINWYENTSSPTSTLLKQVKECQDSSITSKSLILILEEIGQMEAARLIRSRTGNTLNDQQEP